MPSIRMVSKNLHIFSLLLICLFMIILCNCYPFFSIEPYSKHMLYPNAFALKLGLTINAFSIIIIGLTPYLYTLFSLKSLWFGYSRRAFVILGVFIFWTMIPGLIVISTLLLLVIPCESLDLGKGFNVYYGYLSTTILGLVQWLVNPVIFLLILVFLVKKYKGSSSLSSGVFIYAMFYWFMVSIVVTSFASVIGVIIDYILGFISPVAPSLYLRGWHPEAVKNLVEIASSERITVAEAYRSSTALPTWGTLIGLIIMSILVAKTTKWVLGKLGIKAEVVSMD